MKDYLKIKIYEFYEHKFSILEFEKWVYEDSKRLEKDHEPELYLELISFNYKSKYARQEFFKKFDQYINWGEYESWRLHIILDSIINKDSRFYECLIETYDLRNYGYHFFEELGMGYGLKLYGETNYGEENWYDKDRAARGKIIEEYHAIALKSALQVKNWIQTGKIVLTGRRGEYNRYIYIDNRKPEELSPAEIEYLNRDQQHTIQHKPPPNKWWKFWEK